MTLQVAPIQSTLKAEDGTKKWYPRIVKVGKTVTSADLARDLAGVSTLSLGDSRNVFANMMGILRGYLLDSRSVCIDDFGTFTVTCQAQGNGVDTLEEVSPKQITGLKVRFTPSYTRTTFAGTTRAMFTGVDFEMYGSRSKSVEYVANDNSSDGGGNNGGGGVIVDPNG